MTGSFYHLLSAVAATAADAAPGHESSPAYQYVPFLKPLPVWGDHVWPWLLVPLCVAVAVVYKSIRCRRMSQVPGEAAVLTAWILIGMAVAAAVLALIVEATEMANT